MNKLISRSLQLKDVTKLNSFPKQLLTAVEKKQIAWINDFIARYDEIPDVDRFTKEFKFFIPVEVKDPLTDVFEQEVSAKRNIELRKKINEHRDEIDKGADPLQIVEELHSAFQVNTDSVFNSQTFDDAYYFDAVRSFPFWIPSIDEATGGIADGDLVYIVGRPGSNKTTFIDSRVVRWLLEGYRILYVSNENSPSAMMPKIDAFFGRWNPIMFRKKTWTEEIKMSIATTRFLLSKLDGQLIIPSAPCLKVTELIGQIKASQPDIIVIDGVYLMTSESKSNATWESLMGVSRDLKRLARSSKKPIIGIIQANREAENEAVSRKTIGYSDAFLQDADTIISFNRDDGKVTGDLIKTRWGAMLLGERFSFKVNFNHLSVQVMPPEITIVENDDTW